ncbi:MAG: serine hydrolase [Anaerolineae bacterium]|nr:serine hydrolase [Anaerolineae bacterium]
MTKPASRSTHWAFARPGRACATLCLLLALLLSSCCNPAPSAPGPASPTSAALSTAAISRARDYWPTDGWRTSTPEEQDMDPALLAQMFGAIDDRSLDVHGVVIVRNGTIVAERYYAPFQQDTRHVLYSVTKSFTSALVGIAIGEGYIDGVDQPVLDFFPERTFANIDRRKEAMTLEHLLTMTAGLDWEEGMPAYTAMYQSGDWVGCVLDAPMVTEPGEQFVYCSGCSHVLSAIVQETTGMSTLEYALSRLFRPLGIATVSWESDDDGIRIGGWGLNLTPRDMAKFGYLYLNDGVWDGQQVVPAEWVRTSVEKHVETDDDLGYGYQWWTYPSLDAYAAIGRDAQLIFVIPDQDVVAVFTAELDDADALFELIEEFVAPAAQQNEI